MSRRRGLAFLGVVPLGAFVFVHLAAVSSAMSGGARFDRVVSGGTLLGLLTFVVVVLPLVAHAIWGAWVAVRRPRTMPLPSWLSRWRRGSALVTLAFVLGHVVELPLRRWTGSLQSDGLFDVMTAHLSATWHSLPLVALGYLVGTAATLLHLGLAGWASFRASGVQIGPRGNALLKWGLVVGGGALFALAASTVIYLATGTRLLYPAPVVVPDGPPSSCSPKS